MAQTIAKFVELNREDAKNLKHPYVVWKMENREGPFWVSYTEKSFPDKRVWDIIASQEQLVGKLTLLLGYWREVDYQKKQRSWKGEGFKVTKCYLISEDFLLTNWDKKENEYLPEKSLREVE